MLGISQLTKEFLKVPVSLTEGGRLIDPTGSVVEFAFVVPGMDPTVNDWIDGSWEVEPGAYYARALVGPGSNKTLDKGTHNVWIRLTGVFETVVRHVDQVRVQ